MSTVVLPSLVGLGIDVTRTPIWDTITQAAISGKETRIMKQTSPRYQWDVMFNVVRASGGYTELQSLLGFFNSRQGMFDTFLYQDPDDNVVIGQAIGTGDGTTRVFQLVRTYGGFVEPVLAPNASAGVSVYLNGTITAAYTLSQWGSTSGGGIVTFTTAPSFGVAITANINYYWPCRMNDDKLAFNQAYPHLYKVKKFSFMSVKN